MNLSHFLIARGAIFNSRAQVVCVRFSSGSNSSAFKMYWGSPQYLNFVRQMVCTSTSWN